MATSKKAAAKKPEQSGKDKAKQRRDERRKKMEESMPVIGHDPFNGLITRQGLDVIRHRKGQVFHCKNKAEAEAKFDELVADTQY